MRHPAVAVLLLGLVLSAGAAAGQTPATVEPPGFSFVGTWACEGAMSSGRAHRSTYVGTRGAVPGTVELTETDIDPAGYVGRYILVYDAARKEVVEADVNPQGAALYRGPGWQDGRLELTTHDGGDFRFVFQVSDASAFEVTWQVSRNGAWRDGDHLTCHRQA